MPYRNRRRPWRTVCWVVFWITLALAGIQDLALHNPGLAMLNLLVAYLAAVALGVTR